MQAALGETPGCRDQAHNTQETCNADNACVWQVRGPSASCQDKECPSPPPLARQAPLYLDFLPAFISVIYEAVGEDGNILDDDILQIIANYESELFTTVDGAELNYNGESRPSAWDQDWCLLSYGSLPMSTPKCSAGIGPTNVFSMNTAGRAKTKELITQGHNMMGGGALACLCGDSDTCGMCNADGSVKGMAGANMTALMMGDQAELTSLLGQWPTSITSCLLGFVTTLEQALAAQTTVTTTTTTTTSTLTADAFLQSCLADGGGGFRGPPPVTNAGTYLLTLLPLVGQHCSSNSSCMLSPPGTSMLCASSAYYPATDATGMATGAEKEALLTKLCDPNEPLWFNAKNTFLPISFDCANRKSKYAIARFFAGAPSEDEDEAKRFQTGYVEGRSGWYAKASQIEAKYEREHGSKLRIMLFSGATVIAQYLQILAIDGFLSFGSLISVWLYMWFMLESLFLASCGMFEIVFSLPVGMCLWVLVLGNKIFWYQMLVIYMILGIGADDVFILYDAWLQSAHVEGVKESIQSRFSWAYRRSTLAMLITTLTTCGSFAIGATSPLPLVQSFCIFAAVVVMVDYLFCISFFASAVVVYEQFMRGYGCCCSCCGLGVRGPGQCFGPGCCWGGFRAIFTCGGTKWGCLPKPPAKDAPPEKRAMEKFFSGPVFRFYQAHKIKLVVFWLAVVVTMSACAGALLRTADKRAPIGRENIDVIKGSDILFNEFEFSPRPVTVSVAFGIQEDDPIVWANPGQNIDTNRATFGGTSGVDLKKPAHQKELLALCRSPDLGQDGADTRCSSRACLVRGSPLPGSCTPDVAAWEKHGIFMQESETCVTGRYCFMEDLVYFWAHKQGNCQSRFTTQVLCNADAGCTWSTENQVCYSSTSPSSFPADGIPEADFLSLVTTQSASDPSMTEFEAYMQEKFTFLRNMNRRYDADFQSQYTGLRLNGDKTQVQFAWISYNATFPRENTVDEANAWYNRWQAFKDLHAPSVGGFQTAELYLFLVTQNEMVKAATMGIGLSLLVSFLVLLATTCNWWSSSVGLVCIVCITATFLGIVPLLGWSLGENECIFMIATVGLSVDYTVHLLHAYDNAPFDTRTERAHAALEEMGISVANSAITTLFAAAMLFACGFYFFFQFGGFIFMVIGLSILMSTNFLMPMMMLIGPERDQGRMTCCCERRRYAQVEKIGRKETE
ncbi:unnamed protein product [Effrenium voratum]|uniref:SSD domain-containing protein n=1 Tax=Effrenium voratum TaxID=2562239 RepID=A0AA36JPH4_9DINO|nr:unnamed protein product [Effrenium voratum]